MAMMRRPRRPQSSFAQLACRIGEHSLHDIADEALVLRSAWNESGRLVAAPDDEVGRRFDIGDLVAVDHVPITGK
jgi:hypothetical protein